MPPFGLNPPLPPPLLDPAVPLAPAVTVVFPNEEASAPPLVGVADELFTPAPAPAAKVPLETLAGIELVEAFELNHVAVPAVGAVVLFAGPPIPLVPTP